MATFGDQDEARTGPSPGPSELDRAHTLVPDHSHQDCGTINEYLKPSKSAVLGNHKPRRQTHRLCSCRNSGLINQDGVRTLSPGKEVAFSRALGSHNV